MFIMWTVGKNYSPSVLSILYDRDRDSGKNQFSSPFSLPYILCLWKNPSFVCNSLDKHLLIDGEQGDIILGLDRTGVSVGSCCDMVFYLLSLSIHLICFRIRWRMSVMVMVGTVWHCFIQCLSYIYSLFLENLIYRS